MTVEAIERMFLDAVGGLRPDVDLPGPDFDWLVNAIEEENSNGTDLTCGMLFVELTEWERLGIELRTLEQTGPLYDRLEASDAFSRLRVFVRDIRDQPQSAIYTPAAYHYSSVSAIEDLRPERVHHVRVMLVASDAYRAEEIRRIDDVAAAFDEQEGAIGERVDEISWALSGHESALFSLSSPASWRSNDVVRRSPGFAALRQAVARLGSRVLAGELGRDVSLEEVMELMDDEATDEPMGIYAFARA